MYTIDKFSLFRIISLKNHTIYNASRKRAAWRVGKSVRTDISNGHAVCEIKKSNQNGSAVSKKSTFSAEKNVCSQLTKSVCQSKKFQ